MRASCLKKRSLEHPGKRQVGVGPYAVQTSVLYLVGKANIPALDEYWSGSDCALVTKEEKDRLETGLHEFIVHVLGKWPKLGYFRSVFRRPRKTQD